MKSSEISIKTRSTPVSLSFKGQATNHTAVKWSIAELEVNPRYQFEFNYISFLGSRSAEYLPCQVLFENSNGKSG